MKTTHFIHFTHVAFLLHYPSYRNLIPISFAIVANEKKKQLRTECRFTHVAFSLHYPSYCNLIPISFAIVANEKKTSYEQNADLWLLMLNFTFFPVSRNLVKL